MRGLHILHVEDDPILVKAFDRFFRLNYPNSIVTQVDSASKAVECLRAIRFDAILSDFDLKGDTAVVMLDFLRTEQPKQLDKVVILSGNRHAGNYHSLVLEKPCANATIKKTIDRVAAK
jgi:DNA-binding NarL/FixJ family response regulator